MMKFIWILLVTILFSCSSSVDNDKINNTLVQPSIVVSDSPPISLDRIKSLILNIDSIMLADDNRVMKTGNEFRKFCTYLAQGRTTKNDVVLAAQSAGRSCDDALSILYGMAWPKGTPDTLRNAILVIVEELNSAYGTQSMAYNEAMAFFEYDNKDSYNAYMAGIDKSNQEKLTAVSHWVSLKQTYGISSKKSKTRTKK